MLFYLFARYGMIATDSLARQDSKTGQSCYGVQLSSVYGEPCIFYLAELAQVNEEFLCLVRRSIV